QGLALGTVAVAARVVGDPLMAAVGATLDVAAQRRRAADRQIAQRSALRARQRAAILRQERIAVFTNHVRHFQRRPRWADAGGHAWPSVAVPPCGAMAAVVECGEAAADTTAADTTAADTT